MKKLIVLLFIMVIGTHMYAQKSYITTNVTNYLDDTYNGHIMILTGDVPNDVKNRYSGDDKFTIGKLLNILSSKYGYEVEMMSQTSSSRAFFLLSKKNISDDYDPVQHIKVDNDVKEVARCNLQGLPVRKNEKGLQIVVYSNYTTKTVIVE